MPRNRFQQETGETATTKVCLWNETNRHPFYDHVFAADYVTWLERRYFKQEEIKKILNCFFDYIRENLTEQQAADFTIIIRGINPQLKNS